MELARPSELESDRIFCLQTIFSDLLMLMAQNARLLQASLAKAHSDEIYNFHFALCLNAAGVSTVYIHIHI